MKNILFSICSLLFLNTNLNAQNNVLKVGDEYQGGVIFFIEDGHGLIVSKKDLPKDEIWEMAKYQCENLEIDSFKGWRMPNNREWLILYRVWLTNPKIKSLISDFTVKWSSTVGPKKYDKSTAYVQYFTDGSQSLVDDRETAKYETRPIRSF